MMMNELLLPFQFAFMNSAFLIMTIIAVPTSLLSCFNTNLGTDATLSDAAHA